MNQLQICPACGFKNRCAGLFPSKVNPGAADGKLEARVLCGSCDRQFDATEDGGARLPFVPTPIASVSPSVAQLHAEIVVLRRLNAGLVNRVAAAAEVLGRVAGRMPMCKCEILKAKGDAEHEPATTQPT